MALMSTCSPQVACIVCRRAQACSLVLCASTERSCGAAAAQRLRHECELRQILNKHPTGLHLGAVYDCQGCSYGAQGVSDKHSPQLCAALLQGGADSVQDLPR